MRAGLKEHSKADGQNLDRKSLKTQQCPARIIHAIQSPTIHKAAGPQIFCSGAYAQVTHTSPLARSQCSMSRVGTWLVQATKVGSKKKAGSHFSTGVAAFRLGFKFIGCEMNEEYCEIAKKRIEHAAKDSAS